MELRPAPSDSSSPRFPRQEKPSAGRAAAARAPSDSGRAAKNNSFSQRRGSCDSALGWPVQAGRQRLTFQLEDQGVWSFIADQGHPGHLHVGDGRICEEEKKNPKGQFDAS